jgi:hypothetical protein
MHSRFFVDNSAAACPKLSCYPERINRRGLPPASFIANLVILTMMGAAQRYHEFVA